MTDYDRQAHRLYILLQQMIEDCELIAEFDDTVTISVDREDFVEVTSLMYQNNAILDQIDTLHCNDADEGC